MEIKELRVGNWVYDSQSRTKRQLKNIMTTDLSEEVESEINAMESIPLTEEWLLDFGFKNNNWNNNGEIIYYGYEKNGVLLETDSNFSYLCLDGKHDEYQNIKYVHQLQNLYFALTNTELQIKE